jgi:hypothetical protein
MKAVWKVARAVVAAAALALAGGAQGAIVYDVNFDPFDFFGNGQLRIDPACLDREDGTYSSNSENCPIDVLFMHANDTGGGFWDIGEVDNVASAFLVQGGQLVAVDLSVTLDFSGQDLGDRLSNVIQSVGCDASGNLQFFIPDRLVQFDGCGGLDEGTYRISLAPEPASMGLTLGALGAAWLARRRRKAA